MAQNDIAGKPVSLPQHGPLVAVGLMSGTSMDGIDVALLRTDGEMLVERGPAGAFAYDPAFRRRLAAALETAKVICKREERPGDLAELERELTLRHVEAVRRFLDESSLRPSDIDIIGFHGQTVLHRPQEALTVQLGDGELLARETGIPVVYDLRANDVSHGGQGAPLVPAYHRALAANLPTELRKPPVAFVNVGGIANITWIGMNNKLIAFDTGPGNALIDQWVAAHAGVPYDPQGSIAAEGAILKKMVRRYLSHPFFEKTGPKSLDRLDFAPPDPVESTLEDGARTLAHVTAASIWRAIGNLPRAPNVWVICGGGRHNRVIMRDLADLARENAAPGEKPARVVTAEEAGLDGDALEAEAWAYLAARSLRGLDITWPATTGCRQAVSGGVLVQP